MKSLWFKTKLVSKEVKLKAHANAKITRPVRKVAVTLMELQTAEREVLRLFNVGIFTKNFKF